MWSAWSVLLVGIGQALRGAIMVNKAENSPSRRAWCNSCHAVMPMTEVGHCRECGKLSWDSIARPMRMDGMYSIPFSNGKKALDKKTEAAEET